ncbi:MAG: hypothetical protein AAGU39_10810 [Sedimentibacter saalensis]|uniref:hypothetical protein n=1 Tax=Sedimentibacter saalensis TaxID=130788 RepID=UPI003158F24E
MLDLSSTKSILRQLNLIRDCDYIRESSVNYTDIYPNQLKNALAYQVKNASYICLFNNIEHNKSIYVKAPIEEIYSQINEIWIKGNYTDGYDFEKNRVKAHIGKNGDMWVGNKGGPHFYIDYKPANLETLFNDHNEIITHQDYQALLLKLGTKLGFLVKVANGDMGKYYGEEKLMDLSTISFKDIELNNIEQNRNTEKFINNIDVIWVNKITHFIEFAFEVEFSLNYRESIGKFMDLYSYSNYDYSIKCFIVAPLSKLANVQDILNLDRFKMLLISKGASIYFCGKERLKMYNNYINNEFDCLPSYYKIKVLINEFSTELNILKNFK